MKKALYLFAHPDDEIMVLPLLLRSGFENYLIYLTEGHDPKSVRSIELKDAVSTMVSSGISVTVKTTGIEIIDCKSYESLSYDLIELLSSIGKLNGVDELISFSYEGGHPDHDTCAILAHLVANRISIPLIQFSGYRSTGVYKFFRTMRPSEPSDKVSFQRIRACKIMIKLIFSYPSQFKSWLGLGPGIFFSYMFRPWRVCDSNKILSLGDVKYCLYERRSQAVLSEVESQFARIVK